MPATSKLRLGEYRKTPAGYPAFHIETPPGKMKIEIGEELLLSLDRATLAVGKLVGSAAFLPNSEHFVSMYLRLEAVISSKIEGTRASLTDLLQFEQEWVDRELADDLIQVANHLELIRGLESRDRAIPLTLKELERAHHTLLKKTRGVYSLGKLRTVQNWIGAGGGISQAVFIPPPPGEVRSALRDLIDYMNHDTRLPPIIRAGVAHAYFETIHPFADGNGRIGRYLIHFLLWKCGVVERPILYISHYIRQHQSEYYNRLNAVRDSRGLEEFCLFLSTGIEEVAEEARERANRVVEVRTEYERTVRQTFGRRVGSALAVLDEMYRQPIAEVTHMMEWAGLVRSSASTLADDLASAGILVELTGRTRNRRFALEKYLELFTVLED